MCEITVDSEALDLEKQTSIAKRSPPIWLKILVIFLIGLVELRQNRRGKKGIILS